MITTQLPLPLYSLMLKDNSGAVFFRSVKELFLLPLFTSEENVFLYKQRGQLDCNIIQIPTADLLKLFIESPPSRIPSEDRDFKIVVDPIDSSIGEYMLLDREQILDSI